MKTYYFNEDGNMAIGWLLNNGAWYYLDQVDLRQLDGSAWHKLVLLR